MYLRIRRFGNVDWVTDGRIYSQNTSLKRLDSLMAGIRAPGVRRGHVGGHMSLHRLLVGFLV